MNPIAIIGIAFAAAYAATKMLAEESSNAQSGNDVDDRDRGGGGDGSESVPRGSTVHGAGSVTPKRRVIEEVFEDESTASNVAGRSGRGNGAASQQHQSASGDHSAPGVTGPEGAEDPEPANNGEEEEDA